MILKTENHNLVGLFYSTILGHSTTCSTETVFVAFALAIVCGDMFC